MPSDPRGDYKAVWDDLSLTEEKAQMHITGSTGYDFDITAQPTLDLLRSKVGIRPTDDVLEIGCGIGRVGSVAAPVCRSWTGCDVSVNMLEHAAKRLALFKNVRLVPVAGADLSPIESESMDVVYSTVVFMHLWEYDRYGYVLDAYRVLRPGGRIYIDNVTMCSEVGWQHFETHRLAFEPGARPAHISTHSTPQEFEVYLKRAGFADIQTEISDAWVQGWARKP